MANNPYVNKVIYNNSSLIDLTGDTVTPESLLSGYTAHDGSGAPINGSVTVPTKVSELENDLGYVTNNDWSISGNAIRFGIWTNDSNMAMLSISGTNKAFSITIRSDGTLVGSVSDI